MLGICFSVLALLMVISFMEASQDKRLSEIKEIESYHLQVSASTLTFDELSRFLVQINELPGVETAFLFTDVPAILKDLSSGRSSAVRLRGLSENGVQKGAFAERLAMVLGTLPALESHSIAPSYSLMRSLALSMGDAIELTALRPGRTVRMVPYSIDTHVSGVYQTNLPEFNQQTVLMSLDGIRSLASDDDIKIGIFLADQYEDHQKPMIHAIQQLGIPCDIVTWQELNSSLYAAMMLEKYMMYLVIGLMILIIITNLRNSTARLLRAKQRELAVLRAMGAKKRDLQSVFILQALIVAGIGVVIGISLAVLLIYQAPNLVRFIDSIYYASMGRHNSMLQTPLMLPVNPLEIAVTAITILIVSGLFAWGGSRKLLSNDIMEILLHDN